MKKGIVPVLALLLVTAVAQAAAAKTYTIATVVKLSGVGWFNRMEEGIRRFAKDHPNVNAFQVGPAKADAALQVQMIEDLIAQKVDAICVVPFSVEALEPVLKKAMDKGIVVITHEAENQRNTHWDIEAFDNAAYGEEFIKVLAQKMNYEGKWAGFVGSFTSKSHNQWVDAAVAYAKKNYPKMQFVGKFEAYDDQQRAYEKTKELLKAHPDLKGIQGSASTDPAGAGLAVEEMGLQGKVHVVGTSIPSVSGQYVRSGAVDMIGFWDPADAGYAMNQLALMVLEKQPIRAGINLGVKGYENLKQDGKVLYGQAWVHVTKENLDQYNF
ncbi:autoinducer 2 ABC transporter substrate-binding protein [Carboxydochorda subterranea]|uniref:Autoinducer 2 ABC transporter substrate-binding protein n=1 Tax=Carboxydichorda subterranea TaxID=3109565 RepID=A0ABZ1BWV4_9FIRM|nr:autoinducer 2 ABC transporter substrate-binding protein [Limnochorda sp. L945t]WRP17291.1 autoinducer 2 ABC transporter substrate-binding protein [Limnochorda sp. L945t]